MHQGVQRSVNDSRSGTVQLNHSRGHQPCDIEHQQDALHQGVLRGIQAECEGELRDTLAICERLASDAPILSVEQTAGLFSVSLRTLQRRFRKYVGVTPKWMIRRYWLQEAAARVGAGGVEDWAQLALGLGYFDQTHFINDFTALVGRRRRSTPGVSDNPADSREQGAFSFRSSHI